MPVSKNRIRLPTMTPGTTRSVAWLRFGHAGARPKVYMQAAIHANELPGTMALHHLMPMLTKADQAGRVRGEVILVPTVNPIGLSQVAGNVHLGRYDLLSRDNFNRNWLDLSAAVAERVGRRLGRNAAANVDLIRGAALAALRAMDPVTELQTLRVEMMKLSIDADVVLDLHSDQEGVLHLYTTPTAWPRVAPLARTLGVRVALLAEASGDDPFDEACSMVWPLLAERLGPAVPLPASCVAVTVELRGESDVSNALAQQDAQAIVHYLATQGFIDEPQPALPPALCEPTPLSGSMAVVAPFGGIVVYLREPGDTMRAGVAIAQLIDPIADRLQVLESPVDGVFYARELRRFTPAGGSICKIAGREPRRQGKLLSD